MRLAKKLLPGVPEEALKRVEKGLDVKLPADLREFWKLCGGSRPDKGAEETDDESWWQPGEWSSDFFPRCIPETMAFSILSPRAALEAWERLQEMEGFDRRLLPIAGDGGGDYQCVNVSTISSPHHGKVVQWSPARRMPKCWPHLCLLSCNKWLMDWRKARLVISARMASCMYDQRRLSRCPKEYRHRRSFKSS